MSGFDEWLDDIAPGSAESDPVFPRSLDLEPLGVIGRGGTGVVYRARDPILDREVAVKISRPEGGATAREAMLAEAQRTARIRHPAVVPVHRVSAAEGLLCTVSDLAPARTLIHAIEQARGADAEWPLDRRLALVEAAAGAVAAAHEVGCTHGDLHPGNIALGSLDAPFVLDWGGVVHREGTLSGEPGWLAPERLAGGPPTPEGDVYALGLLLWGVVTLREPRPRQPGESLGAYVSRWRDAEPVSTEGLTEEIASVVAHATAQDPAQRPTASELASELAGIRSGRAVTERRRSEARTLLEAARQTLHRFEGLGRRIVDERTVVVVQRAKVPGHAPVGQKRELWAAEDRVSALRKERAQAWVEATEAATRVIALAPKDDEALPEAHRLLARLWWERLLEAEAAGMPVEADVAERWVRHYDDGPFLRALTTPAAVDLECDVEGATARIYRFEEKGRVLTPVLDRERPMPLRAEPLAPSSWLIEIEAPGRATTRVPVAPDRLEQLHESVKLYTPEQIGQGWIHVPAGRFVLGGDPNARQPLDRCRPWLPDLFFTETCVRSADWLTFLDDLDPEVAAEHAPGESGFMGSSGQRYWQHDGERWRMPPGWDPNWPIFSVSYEDIQVYCAWRSEQEGRTVRLPTEEEWEKASRGVDGRSYPWGHGFDPTFAHMRQSRAGPPRPHRVADYPVDISVYGLRDTAGGMRELTASHFDVGQLVIRGGTWGDDADDLRCANRAGLQPDFRYSFISFRLVAEEPRPTST